MGASNTSHMSEIKMGILGFITGMVLPNWLAVALGAFINGALGAMGAILVTWAYRKLTKRKSQ